MLKRFKLQAWDSIGDKQWYATDSFADAFDALSAMVQNKLIRNVLFEDRQDNDHFILSWTRATGKMTHHNQLVVNKPGFPEWYKREYEKLSR